MSLSKDRILYEDDHLLIVNKLAGELVVKGSGKVGKLPLLDFLKKDHPGLRAVHRLDFLTSGVILFAKTRQAAEKIKESNFEGWKKAYRTLVTGDIRRKSGTINNPLPARSKGEVDAVTHYKVLDQFGVVTYVEAEIKTGRHHQIRKHFSMINHPLVLDSDYGDGKFNQMFTKELGYRKFFLHASHLSLPHPISGERIEVEAQLPKAFSEVLKRLKG